MTTALIDADMVLFQSMASSQVDLEVATDIWICQADVAEARTKFWQFIEEACHEVGAPVETAVLCFTSRSRFRRTIYSDYKAQRKDRKPPGYSALKTELLSDSAAVQHDQIEADDLISILARSLARNQFIVVSNDKDMGQVPGVHWWPGKEPRLVEDQDAWHHTWLQALTGDASDGYPGCPGLGPVKAAKLLADVAPMDDQAAWSAVRDAFIKAGQTEQQALVQVRLARLLRPSEYDFTTSQLKLWTPTA